MKTTIVARAFSKKQTSVIARELRQIESEFGIITPNIVVERAADKRCPLHKFFEWDDTVASQKYREYQARQLIAKVYVVPLGAPDAEPVRAFVNIASSEDDPLSEDQGYAWSPGLENRPCYKLQVIEYAKMQLMLWRKKFGAYKEFYGVTKEIDALKQ